MYRQAINRRPIKMRENRWIRVIGGWLLWAGMQPNEISIMSVVFAVLAGTSLVLAQAGSPGSRTLLLMAAASFVQLRLLCNLFDGMVAIEGNLRTKSGEIFNELPDRISDAVILVCAGYSITVVSWGSDLGWVSALLAVMTAYVRALGALAGTSQPFFGPMAKPHRMAVLTVATLTSAAEIATGYEPYSIALALAIIAVGCLITIARRTDYIVRELERRPS